MRHGFGAWDSLPILFVRVETDAGIVGWGEAFGHASTPVTKTAISEIIAKLAVGRDSTDVPTLMAELTRKTQSMARSGPVQFALSGLDIALWDIAGKAAGQPLWKLLGGKERKPTIPAYASLFRLGTTELAARVAANAVQRGYRHIKLHEHSVDVIAAAREAIGPDVSLMVDANCYWDDPDKLVAVCKQLEPYNLTWLEEPLYPADAYDVMARVRQQTTVPLAAGENLGNFNDVRWIAQANAVDVIQPSVAKIGGITELRKAIAWINQCGIRAAPHSPFLGPALMAVIHVIAAMPDKVLCEHRFCDLAESPLGDAVVSRNGRLVVPDGPGLGFEVDAKVIEKYRVS
ncbi:MAG TPA: mandelate racemase/muconate lactonizing enzyme family protein [Xanthobacteraceae bacterium]|nr:mandelate racemase/muconate lactonizing enzyme family protein [Xanthobacteraceae bacterium]